MYYSLIMSVFTMFKVRLPSSTSKATYQDCTKTETTVVPRCELSSPTSEPVTNGFCQPESDVDETTYTFSRHAIRSNYMDKSIEAKKKVNVHD